MQKDFMGDILGHDVRRLRPIVPVIQKLRRQFHESNLLIIQTIEGHKSDLSDCPNSKRIRGSCDSDGQRENSCFRLDYHRRKQW
jgi:biuret amidohydrolase